MRRVIIVLCVILLIGSVLMIGYILYRNSDLAGKVTSHENHHSLDAFYIQETKSTGARQPESAEDWWIFARNKLIESDAWGTHDTLQLCWFLENIESDGQFAASYTDEIKNDLLNRLAREVEPERFLLLLKTLLNKETQSPTVKAYAVQHLSAWSNLFPDNSEIESAFWKCCTEPNGPAGPTALLALRRLRDAGKFSSESKQRFSQVCRSVAKGNNASDIARMTALDILRNDGDIEALEVARNVIGNQNSVALTIVAIGTLGDLGNGADLDALQHSELERRAEFQAAFKFACKNLKERINL